jgi:hypothetical protein
MDSTALQELIAQVRGTTVALAEAEQRVASFTAELARQPQLAQPAPPIRTPVAKRGLTQPGPFFSKLPALFIVVAQEPSASRPRLGDRHHVRRAIL